jgi:catechol 2,3-dioxygenase-like lactoylglutathione lyase family enzyme
VFDHVTIRVSDLHASQRFYETVLATLGLKPTFAAPELVEWHDFSLLPAAPGEPVTERLHLGFGAPSRAHVDAFWQAGTAAGYRDDGVPGPRPEYRADYYGGFLLDPDGQSAEAVHHDRLRAGGVIDHLWIRVADVATSRRFYETIAPSAGFRLGHSSPELTQFVGSSGSFSVVRGTPAVHVHMAFPADTDAAVDAFHATAVAAGYRDNGAPGERPVYHPGYYAAFVLDPDGHNVEVVNHHRDSEPAGTDEV